MATLTQTVVAGGVVYPAGTAETDELREKITNPAFWGETARADDADETRTATVTVSVTDSQEFRDYVAQVGAHVAELESRNEELEQQVADLNAELEAVRSAAASSGDGDDSAPDGADGSTVAPEASYGDLDLDGLKAEIDRRNEKRDEGSKLSKRGGKDTLVAALVADDEQN